MVNGKLVEQSSDTRNESSNSHTGGATKLTVNAVSARDLRSVEHFGKQDPYLQFSLDFTNKDSFLKTFTHKDGGKEATWNQSFTIELNGEEYLYVEVLDEENTADEVIGFAAIPIASIVHAPGANMNGLFTIYDTKQNNAGVIHLQLSTTGFPTSEAANFNTQPIQGRSEFIEGHCARIKSNDKKSTGLAIGGGLLGVGLAAGAAYMGKKAYDNHQQQEQEEEEKRNQERQEFEQEKARFEQEKSDYSSSHEKRNDEDCHKKKDCDKEKDCRKKKECDDDSDDDDAKKWNPVGTYAAGDRVKYHGQIYMCLQGHTSNPTWKPTDAHSLWESE
ncbi:C2 domain-containing protein [Parasitella parasitica]|nr:C2 domain-containing protein [Parasitella parasitica]